MIERNDPCPLQQREKKKRLATVRVGLIGPDLAIARIGQTLL
jgi:hypothetical protein